MKNPKILMTTMSLDIGGAETHIAELSRSLKEEGYDVTVASNGGVYVPILEAQGIKHITLPLHNKHPLSLIKSYRGLKKLIKRENYDIVHAHARIPAFICGLLQKKLKFNFVTTAHGTFEVTPLFKLISNWGDRTLAVSYDIKNYLIENYGIYTDNITLTVNGIDMNRFKEQDREAVSAELGLSNDTSTIKIVHVSRLDSEVTCIAHNLIDAVKRLMNENINVELVIVGDGTGFADVKEHSERINAELGKKAIILTGSRTDVDRVLSVGDIFVGVSRSALEAMAEGKPTILAGAQGYGGIFNKSIINLSLNTNFCFRGEAMPNTDRLYSDIKTILSLDEKTKEEYRALGKETVEKYYSVKRMCEDAKTVYSELMSLKKYKYGDVILSGYYGFGNLGDDSLLEAIVRKLRAENPDIKITVLSKNPKETSKRYGVRSINRFNIPKIMHNMRKAKVLVNGGGSLLQNSTSTRSLVYYISIMRLAKLLGLKVMLYASGIGPLYGDKNKERCRRILDKTDVIYLREQSSYNEVLALGVKNKNIAVTVDPAFSTIPTDKNWVKYLCEKKGVEFSGKFFAVSVRSWQNMDADAENKLENVINSLKSKYNMAPIFISMQHEKDFAPCRTLADKTGGKMLEGLSASELCTVLSQAEVVIAMRLHALIYALSGATPVVGLTYDPKISAVLSSFDLPYSVNAERFDEAELADVCVKVLDNRAQIAENIRAKLSEKKKLSDMEAGTVCEMIK